MKRFEAKIEKYYCNKLTDFIISCLQRYMVDVRTSETKVSIVIEIKKPIYKDEYYRTIFSFRKKDALEFLCNQEELHKRIIEHAKNYFEYGGK